MKCRQCGINNPAGNKTCFVCGARLPHISPEEIELPTLPKTKSFRGIRNLTFGLKLRKDAFKSALQYFEMQWQILRRPWWAAWLSIIPGLGQAYNRQWIKALVYFSIYLILIIAIIIKINDQISDYIIYFALGLTAVSFVDALVTCLKKYQDIELEFQPTRRQKISAFFYALFAFGLLLIFLQFEFATAFRLVHINNNSLMPIVQRGDRVCINCVPYWFRKPIRGDVVWYHTEQFSAEDSNDNLWIIAEGTNIEKVIGLPGERVELRDKKIYINNIPLGTEYEPLVTKNMPNVQVQLPENTYFILRSVIPQPGDTLADHLGMVLDLPSSHTALIRGTETWQRICSIPEKKIIGKVWFIYDPPQRRRFMTRTKDKGQKMIELSDISGT
ncbi:MAG: signal peptidase I [bacterium]|nr:signal peptidase I [bacterium]